MKNYTDDKIDLIVPCSPGFDPYKRMLEEE